MVKVTLEETLARSRRKDLSPEDAFALLIKKFKKKVEESGILKDLKKKQFYEKPSIRKKKKHIAALKVMKKDAKKKKEREEREERRKSRNRGRKPYQNSDRPPYKGKKNFQNKPKPKQETKVTTTDASKDKKLNSKLGDVFANKPFASSKIANKANIKKENK